MKLSYVRIRNFRSCQEVELDLDHLHALVGANNAGKSTILRALEFLFNPSTNTLNEESFWNKDIGLEIRVEAKFSKLNRAETEALKSYLLENGDFFIARSAKMGASGEDDEEYSDSDEDKIKIGQHYKKLIPEAEWLQEANINSNNITEWWKVKETIGVGGLKFCEGWTKKPGVGDWKNRAQEFIAKNKAELPFKEAWIDNPKGYANVLKGTLPFFVFVPAVRDVTDESKGTKSSPFGKLLSAIVQSVTDEKKTKIEQLLSEVSKQMNRSGGDERVSLIADTEKELNKLLGDFFMDCDLEIEFNTPTLEVLLSAPRIYVDDGFRNSVENKGHGLQRAVIFTILRRYAEFMTSSAEGKKRNLILAVEEPELYMHPQAQRTIRQVFQKIAGAGDQVFFSTHSSLLVDVTYFDEIIRMESSIDRSGEQKKVASKAWQLKMDDLLNDLVTRIPSLKDKVSEKSMRDLYSHAYNPRRNEGFFASKVILVEGLTEEYSLPIYADAMPKCSLDALGISVVECGGKGPMDRLFRIFNELHIPCYMIFDYDKGNTDKNVIAKSKELLSMAGEQEDAPEALLVSEGVACFPSKWEVDLRAEIPDMESLTRDARKELGLNDDSGKPLVARYIARNLTSRDPVIIPHSIKTIVEKAILISWKKSCLARSKGIEVREFTEVEVEGKK